MSLKRTAAFFVHFLTASGVLCSLMALLAIMDQAVDVALLWLGLALVIDTVDGPLARLVDTKTNLPRFSGDRLDLIIDYLNYVVLPALLVVKASIIEGQWGIVAAALMLMTSLYHFSDVSSKTRDGYFIGFPAIWNVVVFYFLAFEFNEYAAFLVVVLLSILTFIPFKWLHPFRVLPLRTLTAVIVLVWACVAFSTILAGFHIGLLERLVLAGAAFYIVGLSFRRNIPQA